MRVEMNNHSGMFIQGSSIFGQSVFEPKASISKDSKFVFVADLFEEDYVGGAELTLQALIDSCPATFSKIKAQQLTPEVIASNVDKFWIFGNFSSINFNLLPQFIAQCSYAVVECDYKFCQYRSIDKHKVETKQDCDCQNKNLGRLVADFYHAAKTVFWMSEKQKKIYDTKFDFLADKKASVVLSSVFKAETLEAIQKLSSNEKSDLWITLGSNSWVKGAETAKNWCIQNNKKFETVWNLSYPELLKKLSTAKGLVYLPEGGDTCPRLVIEARLLGCELVINQHVQNLNETSWFSEQKTDEKIVHLSAANSQQKDKIYRYLSTAISRFWDEVLDAMVRQPKISGYVTTYDCIRQSYPYEKCIQSLLNFCTEVCILDGGSKDGTWEKLEVLAQADNRVKIKQIVRDWNSPRFSVFDGEQKAEARKMCSSDYCWQADCDEVFHEDDVKKIWRLCYITHSDIVALPVVEYWGSTNKVRIDVTPWKWRLTKNKKHITHGIPKELRRYDANGELYSAPGSDGCDFIHAETFERLHFVGFYTQEAENARQAALHGNQDALAQYEQWFNNIVAEIPAAYHYSWLDIARKIKLYRDYWQKHWNNLANSDVSDTAENNMFFDVPWSQVTDDMIVERAQELAEKTGGHVFHSKWNGTSTPSIRCFKTEPLHNR